ncbi:MAG: glutamate formimidoyltransferase [Anaerolineaceae bacterium]|nr:glutamate formimidoyltransferase [Anaerolineaceae bacterium]
MKQKLVECVPNFSEGRRPEVIEAIVGAIQSASGVVVLNYSSDVDHNRSVVTFVGALDAVGEAAYRAIQAASNLINMEQHQGTHPRLGATDVVPFVPLGGTTMEECIKLAHDIGKRVGKELGIPVYLYEEAAKRPDRKLLEQVRRGQYEGLKATIENDPERAPDYGPAKVGIAGATIIGARNLLVAFNVYLTSDDVKIAQQIARVIRASSGGFPHVKALGMLVNGQAQVSMNFTNTTVSPLFPVMEAIRREAERLGTAIHHSELIGLISNPVLMDVAASYLQLEGFDKAQILEYKLSQAIDQNKFILE